MLSGQKVSFLKYTWLLVWIILLEWYLNNYIFLSSICRIMYMHIVQRKPYAKLGHQIHWIQFKVRFTQFKVCFTGKDAKEMVPRWLEININRKETLCKSEVPTHKIIQSSCDLSEVSQVLSHLRISYQIFYLCNILFLRVIIERGCQER